MKILFLSQFFSSTRGGGEYLFYILAKKLADRNHQVWVITNKIEGESYPSHKNIKIIFVPPVLIYQGGLPPSIRDNFQYLVNATRVGSKIIKENNIDIIHSNNFTPALTGNFIAILTSRIHITSIWDIFTLCGCDYWKKWVQQTKISKINQFLGPIFEKLVLKIKCDAFHTISEASKKDLLKFGSKKSIYIIPPTIEEILPENVIQNNKQFIFVGRLVFYKNVEILIKAIKIIKEKEKEVKLIIVGGGPLLQDLRNMVEKLQIEKNVIIKGFVDAKEKSKLIAQSNALLFPSMCEGFGLVILESFQQKRPVLVSDIPPMSDIIKEGKTGFILNPQNEEEWAKKIIHLINHQNDSITMGENGYTDLMENYNQELFYGRIIKMYNSILKKY
jgi:glycosyltransferase involved in cell wall biosynthesis